MTIDKFTLIKLKNEWGEKDGVSSFSTEFGIAQLFGKKVKLKKKKL